MNKLEFLPYKLNKNEINNKLAKFDELSRQEKDNIFIEIKKFFDNKKVLINENNFIGIISNNIKLNFKIPSINRNPSLKKDNLIKSNYIFI